MIIDTPGLREVQVVGSEESIEEVFPKISKASEQCRFRDCTHASEPGCGVQRALEEGTLSTSEVEQYEKLKREAAFSRRKIDQSYASEEKKKWKSINKAQRQKRKIDGR